MEEGGVALEGVWGVGQRDNGLPFDFEVSARASTVKWDKIWPQPKEMILEETSQGLYARTIEYAMIFDLENQNDAEIMLKIIDDRFTLKAGQNSEPHSWEIPDVRLIGLKKVRNAEEVISNHFLQDSILTLANKALEGVEYRREIQVNKLLAEVID